MTSMLHLPPRGVPTKPACPPQLTITLQGPHKKCKRHLHSQLYAAAVGGYLYLARATHIRQHEAPDQNQSYWTCRAASVEQLELPQISRIQGELQLPGSKSLSNRNLLLAALASGTTSVVNILVRVRPQFVEQRLPIETSVSGSPHAPCPRNPQLYTPMANDFCHYIS